jgi:ATP/ADP translocase
VLFVKFGALCHLQFLIFLPHDSDRYYPLFGLMANVALIFSGQYVKYVSGLRSGLPAGTAAFPSVADLQALVYDATVDVCDPCTVALSYFSTHVTYYRCRRGSVGP